MIEASLDIQADRKGNLGSYSSLQPHQEQRAVRGGGETLGCQKSKLDAKCKVHHPHLSSRFRWDSTLGPVPKTEEGREALPCPQLGERLIF